MYLINTKLRLLKKSYNLGTNCDESVTETVYLFLLLGFNAVGALSPPKGQNVM